MNQTGINAQHSMYMTHGRQTRCPRRQAQPSASPHRLSSCCLVGCMYRYIDITTYHTNNGQCVRVINSDPIGRIYILLLNATLSGSPTPFCSIPIIHATARCAVCCSMRAARGVQPRSVVHAHLRFAVECELLGESNPARLYIHTYDCC